jgi:orotate phosphoribosyltransferase
MPLIGEAFLREFTHAGAAPRSVGGLTSGADAIANAISYCSLSQGSALDMFSVRKDRKEHGTQRWIEGCGESPVAVVDDVATSGGSVIKAIERCIEEGLKIAHVAVLVDREEGGMDAIRKVVPNLPVTAIFTKSELDALSAQASGKD